MMQPPEHTESLICSFDLINPIYDVVNFQLKVNDLVNEISNTTKLSLK